MLGIAIAITFDYTPKENCTQEKLPRNPFLHINVVLGSFLIEQFAWIAKAEKRKTIISEHQCYLFPPISYFSALIREHSVTFRFVKSVKT